MELQPPPLENVAGDDYEVAGFEKQSLLKAKVGAKRQLKSCSIQDGKVHITLQDDRTFDFPLEGSTITYIENGDNRYYYFKTVAGKFNIARLTSQMPEIAWREFENRLSIKESKINKVTKVLSFLKP